MAYEEDEIEELDFEDEIRELEVGKNGRLQHGKVRGIEDDEDEEFREDDLTDDTSYDDEE